MLDELGDVLFQVHFLSLLMEERGAGDLAQVADHCREKLIRRHPHVFPPGEPVAGLGEGRSGRRRGAGAAQLGRDQVRRGRPRAGDLRRGSREPARAAAGAKGPAPRGLVGLRRRGRRGRARGRRGPARALESAPAANAGPATADAERGELFDAVGDALFSLVSAARKLKVDPELALRGSAARFRASVEAAETLAARAGESWTELDPDAQLAYYAQARMMEDQ